MIKIKKYEEIEKEFFEGRPFDDANEVAKVFAISRDEWSDL